MRLIIQRVKKAKVYKTSDKSILGEIGQGLFVLVGFKKGDSENEVGVLADKLAKLRIMADEKSKMNLSVSEINGEILVVSQFTLYADTSGGNRPSFINAEEPLKAQKLYDLFVEELKKKKINIETGSFGEYMQIEALMDGPVTIIYSD